MRPVRFLPRAAALAALIVLARPASGQAVDPFYNLVPVVSAGLTTPRALTFTPDGRIWVSERTTGRIRVIKNGTLLAKPFVDVPVNFAGDRGALGLAAAPDFATSHRIYLLYARSSTGADSGTPSELVDLRVVSFLASGDTALAGPETLVRSFALDPLLTTHVGGALRFGPEGALYLGLGDADAVPSPALSLDALPGKVLRLDANGAAWPTNLYAVDGDPLTLPEIFAYGFHDPAYMGAYLYDDPGPPKVVVTDAGDGADDEIDDVLRGKNYGWPIVHGKVDTPAETAYVGTLLNYAPTMWTSGATSVKPTGIAAAFEETSTLPFPAVYWGQALPAAGPCVVEVGYDAFVLPGLPTVGDFGTGFPPVTDVSFPIWQPMSPLPLFDALYILAGSALWKATPNQVNAAPPGPLPLILLAHAGPNPARGDAAIACTLEGSAGARLDVYDARGSHVRALGPVGAGTTIVRWDGTDQAARRVGAGLYFVRLARTGGADAVLRIVRLP